MFEITEQELLQKLQESYKKANRILMRINILVALTLLGMVALLAAYGIIGINGTVIGIIIVACEFIAAVIIGRAYLGKAML